MSAGRRYNRRPMSRAHSIVCASLLAAWCAVAGAQGFGSVSSGSGVAPEPAATDAPAAAAPAAADETAASAIATDPATSAPADGATSDATPAFSSRQAVENPFLTGSAARAAAAAPATAAVATMPVASEPANASAAVDSAAIPLDAVPEQAGAPVVSRNDGVPSTESAANPFLTGSAALAADAAPNPFPGGSAAAPVDASNPFLTGSAAAAAAESAAQASNPFLTGSAARRLASMPGWTAPATTATVAAATTPGAALQAAGSGPDLGATASADSLAFGSSYADAIAGPARIRAPADRILVKKSERRLYLLKGGQVIAEYPIRLGLSPTGPKRYEGDYRTPEGRYELVRRNPNSEFFLSLEVSYPNDQDLARARELGKPPGGLIMIHGQPNLPSKPAEYYKSNDWTNGCIAVSNPDMVDIWLRTDLGTPIEIQP